MLLRSTLIYAPAILLPRLAAVLLLVVATRLLSQTEYGLLALVVTIGEMTDIAVSNWLRVALLRLGGSDQVSRGTMKRAGLVLGGTTLCAMVVAISISVRMFPERWPEFAVAVSLYIVTGSIARFALTILQMQGQRAWFAASEALRAALAIALPVGALLYVSPTFLAASIGTSLAALLAGLLSLIVSLRRSVPGAASFGYKELFLLGAPLIVLAVLSVALGSVERLFLNAFWDASAVALYVAAYSLARQPVDVLSTAVNAGGFPELVRRVDAEGPDAAARFIAEQMALMARLAIPASALLIALRGDIVGLVLPVAYHDTAGAIFPVIVLGVLCVNFKTFVFDNIFHVCKRNWLQAASFLPGAIGAVVLGFWLVPPLGPLGAAYAFLGGTSMALAASVVASSTLLRLRIPFVQLGQAALVALATALSAAGTAAAMAPQTAILLRLPLAAAIGGVVFLIATALVNRTEARRWLGRRRTELRS